MNQATPLQQAPAFYRMKASDLTVTVLCDGYLRLPRTLFPNATEQDELELAKAAFMPPGLMPTAVNCFAVETAGKLILVDTGVGPIRGPATGRLPAEMAAAGLDPSQVSTVLLTHLHGDHGGGLLDAAGERLFPEAEILIAEPEFRFWSDPGLVSRMPDLLKPTAQLAARVLALYARQIRCVAPGIEVAPGIQSVPLFGHTPGHTGFVLGQGEDALFIWADIIHVAAYQFLHPEWGLLYDTDPTEAATTRARIFDRAASERLKVAGMHLAFPGHGHVEKNGRGYRYVPMPWLPLS